jgi:hypothetical protein
MVSKKWMKANLVLQIGISLIFKRICIFSSKIKRSYSILK